MALQGGGERERRGQLARPSCFASRYLRSDSHSRKGKATILRIDLKLCRPCGWSRGEGLLTLTLGTREGVSRKLEAQLSPTSSFPSKRRPRGLNRFFQTNHKSPNCTRRPLPHPPAQIFSKTSTNRPSTGSSSSLLELTKPPSSPSLPSSRPCLPFPPQTPANLPPLLIYLPS